MMAEQAEMWRMDGVGAPHAHEDEADEIEAIRQQIAIEKRRLADAERELRRKLREQNDYDALRWLDAEKRARERRAGE